MAFASSLSRAFWPTPNALSPASTAALNSRDEAPSNCGFLAVRHDTGTKSPREHVELRRPREGAVARRRRGVDCRAECRVVCDAPLIPSGSHVERHELTGTSKAAQLLAITPPLRRGTSRILGRVTSRTTALPTAAAVLCKQCHVEIPLQERVHGEALVALGDLGRRVLANAWREGPRTNKPEIQRNISTAYDGALAVRDTRARSLIPGCSSQIPEI